MAVCGAVAVVGQAVRSPSDKTAMVIRVFMVIIIRRFHCTMPVKRGSGVNPERFLAYPLDVAVCL